MKVYELIKQLQELDQMLEVVVDSPVEGKEHLFCFCEVTEVEEITTEQEDKMVALFLRRHELSDN